MPVVSRAGSQRERKTGQFDAISDDDDTTHDDHQQRLNDLTTLGKCDFPDISNKGDLGLSVQTGDNGVPWMKSWTRSKQLELGSRD